MPLVNTSVPNLIQGVSQQADASRFDGQCELQENALSSIVDGLTKRPNTKHIKKILDTALANNSFIHFINRSETERYLLVEDGYYLCAYNLLNGNEATITYNGTAYKSTLPAGKLPRPNYLNSTNSRENLKALTISDATYLVNTSKSVGIGSTKSPALPLEAMVFIKQGDYAKKYGFDLAIKSGTGGQAFINITKGYASFNPFKCEITGVSIYNGQGGSGFAVGDVIDIPLPSSYIFDTTDVYDDDHLVSMTLTLFTQPTLRVTSIGTNGEIAGLTVHNAGNYYYYGYDSYNDWHGHHGYNVTTGTAIDSTGNTPVSGTVISQTITRQTTSGNAGTNPAQSAAQNADSAVILTKLFTLDTGDNPVTTGDFSTFFTVANGGPNLRMLVANSNVNDFSISGFDGLAGEGIGVVFKEVNSLDDLPVFAKNGFEVKVKGDVDMDEDDYYVRFETVNGETYGNGSWVECVAPDITLGYDVSTLPLEILNPDVDAFTVRPMNFKDRVSGDDESNPLASIVGQPFSNIFFFKNRLGFLSNENIVMSESGLGVKDDTGQLVFNFNRTTVTTLLDDDPIDINISTSRVTNLKAAKGFQENLILFSENGQFVLKGGDVLTPKTISISPVTNFSVDSDVDPIALGAYIYFPFTRSGFTGFREFSINASTDVYDSTEITEHVPRYIPKDIIAFTGTTSEDTLAVVTDSERDTIYVYHYFYSGPKKLLSSWFKVKIQGEIRGCNFIKSDLHIVSVLNNETHISTLSFSSGETDENVDFNTHLDMRFYHKFTSASNTLTIPYTPSDDTIDIYTTNGEKLQGSNTGNVFTFNTQVPQNTEVWGGIPYTMKYTFSELVFKDSAGNNKTPSNSSRLMLKNGTIFYSDTSSFKVNVTPKGRNTSVNEYSSNQVGNTLNTYYAEDGAFRFPIFANAEDTTITLEDSSVFPVKVTSAEFEALVKPRSKRIG